MSKPTCSIPGCSKDHYARTWCKRHYSRWLTYGDPSKGRDRYDDPAESFDARTVQDPSGCVLWTGNKNPKGYGLMNCYGVVIVVHRYAWEQAHGPIIDSLQVDHRCHNRACVNLEHLRLVTNKQNCEHRNGTQRNNKSGIRGVSWDNRSQKWLAVIRHEGKLHYAGYHAELESAALAVKELRNRLFTHNDLDRA